MKVFEYFVTGALFLVGIFLILGLVIKYLEYVESPKRPLWIKIVFTSIVLIILSIAVGFGLED